MTMAKRSEGSSVRTLAQQALSDHELEHETRRLRTPISVQPGPPRSLPAYVCVADDASSRIKARRRKSRVTSGGVIPLDAGGRLLPGFGVSIHSCSSGEHGLQLKAGLK